MKLKLLSGNEKLHPIGMLKLIKFAMWCSVTFLDVAINVVDYKGTVPEAAAGHGVTQESVHLELEKC